MGELVVHGTPWETYDIDDGVEVHVKREDLCCPHPGPSFSKIRGLEAYLSKIPPGTPVGVLDTVHSKAGWGTAYLCKTLDLPCYNFYPVYVKELDADGNHKLRHNQKVAADLGAMMVPLSAGRSFILYHQAKKELGRLTGSAGVMLPNALKLDEAVDATAAEVVNYTPDALLDATWVVSVSSGTIAAGVLKGLHQHQPDADLVLHLGYSRSKDAVKKYVFDRSGVRSDDVVVVDEGYAYKDKVSSLQIPFPCNEYYDAKAWWWLVDYGINELRYPLVFWNIGA